MKRGSWGDEGDKPCGNQFHPLFLMDLLICAELPPMEDPGDIGRFFKLFEKSTGARVDQSGFPKHLANSPDFHRLRCISLIYGLLH